MTGLSLNGAAKSIREIRENVLARAPCLICLSALVLILMVVYSASAARADLIPLGDASNYAILYEGAGGNNLSISNVTINGNIGVGGSGAVQFSGPGTINGNLYFSAASTGQYHNTNGSNVGPALVNYSTTNVTTALSAVNTLSGAYSGGTNIAFTNPGETVNENAGALMTIDGVATRVFNVTGYSANNASVLNIVGDGTGDPVVFNFAVGSGNYGNSNVNLGGSIVLSGTGLTVSDQVLFNFQSTGKNISLTNNGETFVGTILSSE